MKEDIIKKDWRITRKNLDKEELESKISKTIKEKKPKFKVSWGRSLATLGDVDKVKNMIPYTGEFWDASKMGWVENHNDIWPPHLSLFKKPNMSYNDRVSFISCIYQFASDPESDQRFQALVFGANENRYTEIAHVIWNWRRNYNRKNVIHNSSWFNENEDLGDIIKSHRALQVQVSILERENKSIKAKLVELYNNVSDLLLKCLDYVLGSKEVRLLAHFHDSLYLDCLCSNHNGEKCLKIEKARQEMEARLDFFWPGTEERVFKFDVVWKGGD